MSQQLTTDGAAEMAWQQLWFSLRGRHWHSLAIVGTERAPTATEVAQQLAIVGRRDEKTPVDVISASGMSFEDTTAVVKRFEAERSPLTLVACDSPLENAAMIPLLAAVSGVVLVASLGATRLEALRRITNLVGRDKVVATVSVG